MDEFVAFEHKRKIFFDFQWNRLKSISTAGLKTRFPVHILHRLQVSHIEWIGMNSHEKLSRFHWTHWVNIENNP